MITFGIERLTSSRSPREFNLVFSSVVVERVLKLWRVKNQFSSVKT